MMLSQSDDSVKPPMLKDVTVMDTFPSPVPVSPPPEGVSVLP